jgi:hypothetical protein
VHWDEEDDESDISQQSRRKEASPWSELSRRIIKDRIHWSIIDALNYFVITEEKQASRAQSER